MVDVGLQNQEYNPLFEMRFNPAEAIRFAEKLEAIVQVANPHSVRKSLTNLVSDVESLNTLLACDARGDRNISLLQHSLDTIEQSIAYQAGDFLPQSTLSSAAFLKFLLLHDSGKSIPREKKDANKYTILVLEKHRDYFAFSEHEETIIKALLSCDPIGRVMHRGVCPFSEEVEAEFEKHRNSAGDIPLGLREQIDPRYRLRDLIDQQEFTIEELVAYSTSARVTNNRQMLHEVINTSANEIVQAARSAGLGAIPFFRLINIFYQMDISAYSMDVGEPENRLVGLEHLLEINPKFSLQEPESVKLFLADRQGNLPLQFSNAANQCHTRLAEAVALAC